MSSGGGGGVVIGNPPNLSSVNSRLLPSKDDLLLAHVKSEQTKEIVQSPSPYTTAAVQSAQPTSAPAATSPTSNLKMTGMSMAKQATEKLKWKFLGW